ncbi:alpha/beta hydrolase [Spirosoma radiotolerans]|uniref:Lipase n=1 Tax=Spirosoma radiotolerans TaxID=1379870 RepID=A0A0E3ZV10_9BACT|nr:lipase [Spirosoma radiotolerans]AKD54850.1 lipase [Spirosoma radiotolerans]
MKPFANYLLPISLLAMTLAGIACRQDTTATPQTEPQPVEPLAGPIQRPTSGYGKDGSFTVAQYSFVSPTYAGKSVTVFYPKEVSGPRPTLFYSHPYGGESVDYNLGLYRFIASKGYVVVFAPYPTLGVTIDERYSTLWQSFTKAVSNYPQLIDTTKVGFVGHSFGGAASFALAHRAFLEKGWGEKGRLIFAMAQWYAYQLSPADLQSFPANTKLITQVYDDDDTNDHRMAIDVFKTINIPNAEKDFVLIRTSELPTYTYVANHVLPNTRSAYDAYDYYGVYRLLDALMDYSFNGNAAAKNTALGNGSAEQVTMPSYNGQVLKPLEVTDNPVSQYSQSRYEFPCTASANPRSAFCP